MLRVIHGADTFTAHERLREILASCGGEPVATDGVQWLDGKTVTPGAIGEACEQVSMFAACNVVVVEGLLSRFSKDESRRKPSKSKKGRSPARDKGEWEAFAARVRAIPESALLILLDGELKGANPLLTSLALATEETTVCPALRPADVQSWIQERVAAAGGRIDRDAATRLGALVGSDLWLLSSEIEKLVVYAGGAPVRTAMVDEVTASAPAPTIFMLVDAIVERSAQLARRRLDDMYLKGLNAGYVFTMVGRQLRIIAQVQEARRHRGAALPAPDLDRLQPFALERARRQAQQYSEEHVRNALERLVAADRAMKTGVFTERMALEMLVTDLLNPPAA